MFRVTLTHISGNKPVFHQSLVGGAGPHIFMPEKRKKCIRVKNYLITSVEVWWVRQHKEDWYLWHRLASAAFLFC